MRSPTLRRRLSMAVGFACTAAALAVATIGAPAGAGGPDDDHGGHDDRRHGNESPVLFFVADGMRQDLVEQFSANRRGRSDMPAMAELLKKGSSASGGGLLTQAPPNTGAGWYSLATGAWPGVHGSTNNTFHVNGQPFGNRTAAFDANVLQAESIAQSAERSGLKVAQVEWAGGRNATIAGPTIDYQTFWSGRGVVTNYVSPSDIPANITAFGLQYDQATPADASG